MVFTGLFFFSKWLFPCGLLPQQLNYYCSTKHNGNCNKGSCGWFAFILNLKSGFRFKSAVTGTVLPKGEVWGRKSLGTVNKRSRLQSQQTQFIVMCEVTLDINVLLFVAFFHVSLVSVDATRDINPLRTVKECEWGVNSCQNTHQSSTKFPHWQSPWIDPICSLQYKVLLADELKELSLMDQSSQPGSDPVSF